jgi:hypothetical protein
MAPESQRLRRAPGRNLKTPTKFRRLGKRTFSGTKSPLDSVALLGHDAYVMVLATYKPRVLAMSRTP